MIIAPPILSVAHYSLNLTTSSKIGRNNYIRVLSIKYYDKKNQNIVINYIIGSFSSYAVNK